MRQLFWKNRAELLACSHEEHDKDFAKLVAGARETERNGWPLLLAETDCMPEHVAHRRCAKSWRSRAVLYP